MSPVELPYVPILLDETFTKALWDTGAEKSFISEETYPKYFFYKQVKKSSTQVITAQGIKCRNMRVVELNIRIRDFKKPWLFHVLANLEYPCILGIYFIGGSKIILDFDRKSLAIQESQVEDIKIDDGNLRVDLSETKLNVVANVLDNNTIESIIGEKVNCAIIRDLVLSSRDQLIEEQKTDPELGHIYRYLENPEDSSVNAAIYTWGCCKQQLLKEGADDVTGSSESVQEFAACINKLGTQIFQSSNATQNTAAHNANDQLLQSRFISGLRNDILRFVLARDPNNLEESINAALIEEQNVKLNQIANDERTGLSPLHTETSVISALTNKLDEINLRVERLQEASSITARKTGGGLFRRRETVFKCFYCGLEGHKKTECRRKRAEERQSNYQPPWGNAAVEFSVFRHPNTHSFDQRRVHFHDWAFRDNYTAPRHSATVPQRTSGGRRNVARFTRNTRNDNLNFHGESRF
ncbi:uncharacterized protein TNCV_3219251 [Trichonephila clavipes]|nr:uncharacterized protein TNCV_3219251 [Trichonephila clavipes]